MTSELAPLRGPAPGGSSRDATDAAAPIVLIAGPTASGKSQLALDLAEKSGAVIINADSMQVYAELSILTARPAAGDLERAGHRLYGHVSAGERYTVAHYLADVAGELAAARGLGRPVVLVGGTGLYFSALTEGLAEIPDIPAEVRMAARRPMPPGARHRWLATLDAAMAERLNPADEQRIGRAIEVMLATGRSLACFQAETGPPLIGAEAERIVLQPDRDWLRERIADRFRRMVEAGGLDEARAFAALRLDPGLPAMKAIGVPEMITVATGSVPVEDGIARAVTATRQFAKRQGTWFRNRFADWRRLAPERAGDVAAFLAGAGPMSGDEITKTD